MGTDAEGPVGDASRHRGTQAEDPAEACYLPHARRAIVRVRVGGPSATGSQAAVQESDLAAVVAGVERLQSPLPPTQVENLVAHAAVRCRQRSNWEVVRRPHPLATAQCPGIQDQVC